MLSSPPPSGWPDPPEFTDHACRQMQKRGIPESAVTLVCNTYQDPEYDDEEDSYKLTGLVEGGLLQVCVDAESFHRDHLKVKTTYWLGRRPA